MQPLQPLDTNANSNTSGDQQAPENNSSDQSSTNSIPTLEVAEPSSEEIKPLAKHQTVLKFIPVTGLTGLIGAMLMLATIVAAYFALGKLYHPPKPQSPSGTLSLGAQSLTPDELNKFYSASGSGLSGNTLTVSANTVFTGNLKVEQDLSLNGKLTTNGPLTANSLNVLGPASLAGTTVNGFLNLTGNFNAIGNGSFSGNLAAATISAQNFNAGTFNITGHIATSGAKPAISGGSALGGGTAAIVGDDTSGTLIFDTGAHPAQGDLGTITFKSAFTNYPKVLLTPVGISSPNLHYYTTRNATTFAVLTLNDPAPNTEYVFDYIVAQ